MPVSVFASGGMPSRCQYGHDWTRPRSYSLSWITCNCACGGGHHRVKCGTGGCTSAWYDPPHTPGQEVRGYPEAAG